MPRLRRIVLLALLVLVSFGAGVFYSAIYHIGSPIVTVQLQNASNQNIASVLLEHEHGSVSVTNIEPGDSRRVHFYAPGESSYKLNVVLADGRTMTDGAGYVEAGYEVVEVISNDTIKSNYQLFSYEP